MVQASTSFEVSTYYAKITAPEEGETIKTDRIDLIVECEVPDNSSIDVYIDDIMLEDDKPISSGENRFDIAGVSSGTHQFHIKVKGGGEVIDEDDVTFDVALEASIQLTSPQGGEVVDDTVATAAWTADGLDSYEQIRLRIDGQPWIEVGTSGTGEYDFTDLDESTHKIDAEVYDGATGNVSAEDSVSFEVDLQLSDLHIDAPAEGEVLKVDDVAVEWGVNNFNPDTDVERVKLDGGAWVEVTGHTHTFQDVPEGTHTITVEVYNPSTSLQAATGFSTGTTDKNFILEHRDEMLVLGGLATVAGVIAFSLRD